MNVSSYKRTEVIGRGKFGIVYKAYNKQTKQVVAIKVLNLDTQEDEVTEVQQEIQFLTELKTVPNVTHYYGSILNDTKLWIIMDYCAGGSVRTLLKAGNFEEKYISVILRELLVGLSAVHKLGVIHRDVKAANVLISKDGNVQLCDFGVAAKITANVIKRTTMAGTPYWMAPEVIREGDTYNSKADIWSLGITIYEIATGNPPYSDKDALWAMQMLSKLTPPRLEGRDYSPNLKEVIALCLDESPEERPCADDLLKCKLVKFYRSYPTTILKEVISRYLLWRDHHSARRDSVSFVSLGTDLNNGQDIELNDDNHIQVKWDFDSLSSREYIMENDITVDDKLECTYDLNDHQYPTQPTLKADMFNIANMATESDPIPKSLQSLFEESPELSAQTIIGAPSTFELPAPSLSLNDRIESPTIEIPDFDKLPSITTQAQLTKPPVLYHSQSASGNLETRFSTNPNSTTSRPRKKTISNSYSITPHTPPYSTATGAGTATATGTITGTASPSPKPPPTATFASTGTGTNSPSKAMKALQSSTNPLLQPINFKADGVQKPKDGLAKGLKGDAPAVKGIKSKPGLHIQMPTPNNGSSLAALTNSYEEINQFGVKPLMGLSMTPVTEKDSFVDSSVADEKTPTPQFRDQVGSHPRLPRKMTASSITSSVGVVAGAGVGVGVGSSAGTSTSAGLGTGIGTSAAPAPRPLGLTSPLNSKTRFPNIPDINSEFFIDSTPKQKLVNELDSLIKLFNVGLEALDEQL